MFVLFWKTLPCQVLYPFTTQCHLFHYVLSSPEHKVLMLSYFDSAVSVVNFLPCARSRGHIFSPILMKLGQNVCLIKISDEFEIESCGVKNWVTWSNLRKTLCKLWRPHFQSDPHETWSECLS